jgi:hypothetical protein
VWPNSFVIRLGDHLLVVACDDDATAAELRRMSADVTASDPSPTHVDYGVRIHPGGTATTARSWCAVQHGSTSLGRSTRSAPVLDGFWRILGAHAAPPAPGTVRLDLGVWRDRRGLVLVPRALASSTAPGWLRDQGIDPVLVHHVDVGVDDVSGRVVAHVAAPLVGDADPVRDVVHTWLVDLLDDEDDISRPHVGEIVAHISSCLAPETVVRDSVDRVASVVTAAMSSAAAHDVLVLTTPGRTQGQRALRRQQ